MVSGTVLLASDLSCDEPYFRSVGELADELRAITGRAGIRTLEECRAAVAELASTHPTSFHEVTVV